MSVNLNIGELQIRCSSDRAAPTLSLSVSLTGSSHMSNEALSSRLLNTPNSLWLCRGRDYKIILQVYVDARPADESVKEHLHASMLSSKFWQQFNMHSSIRYGHGFKQLHDDPSRVDTHLSYCHDLYSSSKSSRHKLLSHVSFTDVRPPEEFPVVEVESVVFVLNYYSSGTCLKQSQKSSFSSTQNGLELLADVCLSTLFLSRASTVYESSNGYKPKDIHFPAHLAWQNRHSDSLSLFDDEYTIYSSQESCQIIESDRSMQDADEEVDMHKLAYLFDAGLRLAIRDDTKMLGKEVVVDDGRLAGRLSTIAPSLWRPGFLQAIAARSVFLPTISHALSYSVYKCCTSGSLRAKLERIFLEDEEGCDGIYSGSDMSDSIYSGLQKRLWSMLQSRLLNTKSIGEIKPLMDIHGPPFCSELSVEEGVKFYSERMYDSSSNIYNCYWEATGYDDDDDHISSYSDFSPLENEESSQSSDMLFGNDNNNEDQLFLDQCCTNEYHADRVEMECEDLLWCSQDVEDEVSLLKPLPRQASAAERVEINCSNGRDGAIDEYGCTMISLSPLDEACRMEWEAEEVEDDMIL